MKTRSSEERKRAILDEHMGGASMIDLAIKYNVDIKTIWRWKDAFGIKKRAKASATPKDLRPICIKPPKIPPFDGILPRGTNR